MKLIINIFLASIITLIVFTLISFKGGFLSFRLDIVTASITNDDGNTQNINIAVFNGFHMLNIVYASLLAILIGLVSTIGLKEIYNSIANDIAKRQKED